MSHAADNINNFSLADWRDSGTRDRESDFASHSTRYSYNDFHGFLRFIKILEKFGQVLQGMSW